MTHIPSVSERNRFDQVKKLQTQHVGCSQYPAPEMSCLQSHCYSCKQFVLSRWNHGSQTEYSQGLLRLISPYIIHSSYCHDGAGSWGCPCTLKVSISSSLFLTVQLLLLPHFFPDTWTKINCSDELTNTDSLKEVPRVHACSIFWRLENSTLWKASG